MRPSGGVTCRPKDRGTQRQSIAFLEKCAKEKEKLQERLTEGLKRDMQRMFDEEIHPDITFSIGNCEISAHKIILQAREGDVYNLLLNNLANDNTTNTKNTTQREARDFIRQLYTTQCAETLVQEFLKKVSNENSSENNILAGSTCVNGNPEDLEPYSEHTHTSPHNGFHIPIQGAKAIPTKKPHYFLCNYGGGSQSSSYSSSHGSGITEMSCSSACSSSLSSGNGSFIELTSRSGKGFSLPRSADNISPTISPEAQRQQFNEIRQASFVNCDTVVAPPEDIPKDIPEPTSETVTSSLLACQQLPDLVTASTNLPHEACCKLGSQLLRMLLQGTASNCVLTAHSQDFRSHKCILASRSKYFYSMFNGSWAETDAEKLHLESVSSIVLEQLLLFLYGGVVDLIDKCDVVELLVIADMYAIDGLKDVVCFNLRYEKCHFFHKPCPGCIAGVPEVFVLSKMYNMPELYERCLKWINKNFSKVWPTKSFSMMYDNLMNACCQRAIKDMTCENVLEVIMECQKISSCLPRLKWSEPVLNVVTQLMDAAIEFIAQHFTSVIASKHFMSLDQIMAWSMSLLDEVFTMVIKSLPMEKACQTYLSLSRLVAHAEDPDCVWTEDFITFIQSLFKKSEDYLKLHIHQVAHCKDWDLLTDDMQKKIMTSAYYVCIDNSNRGKMPPKLTSMQKRRTGAEMIKMLKEDGTYMLPGSENVSNAKSSPKSQKPMKSTVTHSGSPTQSRIPTPRGSPAKSKESSRRPAYADSHRKGRPSRVPTKITMAPTTDPEEEILTVSIVEDEPPKWPIANRQQNINLLKRNNSCDELITEEAKMLKSKARSNSIGLMEEKILRKVRTCYSYFTCLTSNTSIDIIPIFKVTFHKPVHF
ncbi:uncharacterized protein LOC115214974 [Argonauta hians]